MTANNGILTYNNSTNEIRKYYYSPITRLSYDSALINNLYCFIGLNANSTDQFSPNTPIQTIYESKLLYKNIIALKKVNINEISPIIERIDWKANTYYEAYSDTVDLLEKNSNGKLLKQFYVRNRFDQIFKCLWNNINSNNTVNITNVSSNVANSTMIISHEGGTFQIGNYVTLQNIIPSEYNGTRLVIDSSVGSVTCTYTSNTTYQSGGTIKNAILSTDEPTFDVGTFDVNQIVKTNDGYKWKYIYTINQGLKQKFFTDEWMPIPISTNITNPLETVGIGSIDVINVVNGGNNYTDGTNTTIVLITGDGTDASATAQVLGNTIVEIGMDNIGKNYTYANVNIVPAPGFSGNGIQTSFSISPIGGHGFNPPIELGCNHLMISTEFSGSESNKIPTDIYYNQIGLLVNPYAYDTYPNLANSDIYYAYTSVIMSSGSIDYINNEIIYQGDSLANSTFTGSVLSYDSSNSILYLIHSTGDISVNYPIFGSNSGASRIALQTTTSNFINFSGDFIYIENRTNINRNAQDTENFRLILKY